MIGLVIFAVIVFWIVYQGGAAGRRLNRLVALQSSGLRGRALVLSSNFLTSGATINGQRYERRVMTLDVELPGREPYVTTGTFLIARGLVEPVPGSSLDVAVDPSKRDLVAVLGPGGFSGPWIRTGIPAAY